eukprot:453783_1
MKLILSILAITMVISQSQLGGLTNIPFNTTEFSTVESYMYTLGSLISSSLRDSDAVNFNIGCMTYYRLDSVKKQVVNGLNYFASIQVLCDPLQQYAQIYIYKPINQDPILEAINFPTQLTDELTSFFEGNIAINTPATTGPAFGGDMDEHGCYISAGYDWCAATQSCYRWWEEDCPTATIGGDHDAFGCITSAGYRWCS